MKEFIHCGYSISVKEQKREWQETEMKGNPLKENI